MKLKQLENEEQYQEYLKRLVKGAEYLDDPLLDEEDYIKGMKLYNELEQKILEYRGVKED